jgi:hypothetical protein
MGVHAVVEVRATCTGMPETVAPASVVGVWVDQLPLGPFGEVSTTGPLALSPTAAQVLPLADALSHATPS